MTTPAGVVLIVDDSLTVRMDLVEAFETAGLRPVPCATVAEARAAIAREPVLLAILDVLLPDGNGVDLLLELRAGPDGADLPVLMLSSEAEIGDRIRGLEAGADDYVGKPYDAGNVVARARELLRRRQRSEPALRTTILVIDDSATFRGALGDALQAEGYAVLTATTGEEGLTLAARSQPDGVIVDNVMPGIDGATVIRRIRLDAALRGTPCLLLTASESRDAELQALDAGADAFVRKEEDAAVVLARLAAVLRSARAGRSEGASLLGPRRILAVDDSPTYLHQMGAMLRAEGYDVALARSGEEALALLRAQPVDCVLLDLVMPGLGGEETCRLIKTTAIMREIPVVILTSADDRAALLGSLGSGADDFISKSSEVDVLKARVRAQIRRKQFEDEQRRARDALLRRELDASEARAARDLAETRATLIGELERKNKELESFSYSVSHDLRAPLRSIDGFSRVLLDDYSDKLDKQGQDYLRRVRAAAGRMAELIDDLLALSRVGRAELVRRPVDMSALARSVVQELEKREPERRVQVVIEEGLRAQVDERLFRIVFENLLGNAWKFTARTAAPRVELGLVVGEDGRRTWRVRDNGAGFEMSYAQKLFRPFQRLHAESDFPGTGIGLTTVNRIVDRHGGRIWAEGAVNQGASFYFTIPEEGQASGSGGVVAGAGPRSFP